MINIIIILHNEEFKMAVVLKRALLKKDLNFALYLDQMV